LDFILNSLKNQHRETCQDSECQCRSKPGTSEEVEHFQAFLVRNQVRKVLKEG
jgi:hypothetical protein